MVKIGFSPIQGLLFNLVIGICFLLLSKGNLLKKYVVNFYKIYGEDSFIYKSQKKYLEFLGYDRFFALFGAIWIVMSIFIYFKLVGKFSFLDDNQFMVFSVGISCCSVLFLIFIKVFSPRNKHNSNK